MTQRYCMKLCDDLPLSFPDGSVIHNDAVPGTSFSALLRSYLKAAHYSGLSAASSFYKLFLWCGMSAIVCVPKDLRDMCSL